MAAGDTVYDTDEQKIKTYNGTDSAWEKITSAGSFSATGGTTSTDGNYTLHTFSSSGTFTVQSGSRTCNVYVIGGGGSGGTDGSVSSSNGWCWWRYGIQTNRFICYWRCWWCIYSHSWCWWCIKNN